jgi:hypothetical protein
MDLTAQHDSDKDANRQPGAKAGTLLGVSLPASEKEIEITPEMIHAGASVLNEISIDLAEGYARAADVAESVFRAMSRARSSSL